MIRCDQCGLPVDTNQVHVFEDGSNRTVARVCRTCCPRCDSTRTEVAS